MLGNACLWAVLIVRLSFQLAIIWYFLFLKVFNISLSCLIVHQNALAGKKRQQTCVRTLIMAFGGFEPEPLRRWCSVPKLTNTTTYLPQSGDTSTFCAFISKLHAWTHPNTLRIEHRHMHEKRVVVYIRTLSKIMKKTAHNGKTKI